MVVAVVPEKSETLFIPSLIGVRSGENVEGRHVGYGDGLYKSTDAEKTLENMARRNLNIFSGLILPFF